MEQALIGSLKLLINFNDFQTCSHPTKCYHVGCKTFSLFYEPRVGKMLSNSLSSVYNTHRQQAYNTEKGALQTKCAHRTTDPLLDEIYCMSVNH